MAAAQINKGALKSSETNDMHDEKRHLASCYDADRLAAVAQPVLERLEALRRIFLVRHPQREINDQQYGGRRADFEEIARAAPHLLAE